MFLYLFRLRVGHCLKFGGSTRMLIVQGPPDDMEAESELSVTQLKAIAAEKAKAKADEKAAAEEAEAARRRGNVTWGMGDMDDDAVDDEEDDKKHPDMSRNPFAVIREEQERIYFSVQLFYLEIEVELI